MASQENQREEFRLIRAFSNHMVETDNQAPAIIRAVRDQTNSQEDAEALRLRKYFNNVELSSNIDIETLDIEAKKLESALNTFEKSGVTGKNSSAWGLSNLKSIVRNEKEVWENKHRLGSGKVQGKFHDIMGKINSHQSLLSVLPAEDKYFSLVLGSVKALAKASAEHRKTIEKLQQALVEINDEVEACTIDAELVRSEMMKSAVAKLYVAVFLFYADAIEWYKSSARKKIFHGFHDNFSEQFNGPLNNIKRLSVLVSRAAKTGQGAETSVIRLGLEGIRKDVRAGLQGHERALQEGRYARELLESERAQWQEERKLLLDPGKQAQLQSDLWKRIGLFGVSTLQGEARSFVENKQQLAPNEVSAKDSSDIGDFLIPEPDGESIKALAPQVSDKPLDTGAIQSLSSHLCEYISRGSPHPNIDPSSSFLADRRVVVALEAWMTSPKSVMLGIEGPYTSSYDSEISRGAAQIAWSAMDLSIPIIAFFCSVDPESDSGNEEKASNAFLGLVYSFIHQLICLWPPVLDDIGGFDSSKLERLDASDKSWELALDILRDLLKTAPPLLLCVIDGIQDFEDSSSTQVSELIAVLRSGMSIEDKVFKVLFTTSGCAVELPPNLNWDEFERIDIPGPAGRPRPGMMTMRPF